MTWRILGFSLAIIFSFASFQNAANASFLDYLLSKIKGEKSLYTDELTHFIAIGDTGKGNPRQYAVAKAIEKKCEKDRCDFALMLGDNFYNTGVNNPNDPQWVAKFEKPYKNLDFPFYAVLGNHDYGTIGLPWNKKGQAQLDYSRSSNKFIMPDYYYDFKKGPIHFFGLDTSRVFWNFLMKIKNGGHLKHQLRFIKNKLIGSTNPWRIAFGHHPYLSNGKHGNAGNYEPKYKALNPIKGKAIKKLIERGICPSFDIYMSGHDHNLQILKGTKKCPITTIVSGAGGASITSLVKDRNPWHFQSSEPGFMFFVASENKLQNDFVKINSNSLHVKNYVGLSSPIQN
jgi:hypothetical protein